jgi:integrase
VARTRDRDSAKGLLNRMEARVWANGKTVTYRYHTKQGKVINLGQDRLAACRKVLDLLGQREDHGSLNYVWESYTSEEKPAPRWKKLSENTKDDYRQAWKQIQKVFGEMKISQIDSPMVAQYVHIERAASPKRANTEKALLSNLFGHGILLGLCTINATIGVQPHELQARSVAPDPKVLAGFLQWLDKQTPQRRIIGMAAEYASLAGNRQIEFRTLTWSQVDRAGGVIRTFRAKQRGRNKDQIVEVIEIGQELSLLLTRLEAMRPNSACPFVFPNRDGNPYTSDGFEVLWQRCVQVALAEGVLTPATRFTFHDLRSFYATKHKRTLGALPDMHKNPETTARIYDRSKEVKRSSF